MASLRIGVLVIVERFIIGADYEVVQDDACNHDAVSQSLIVLGPQAQGEVAKYRPARL